MKRVEREKEKECLFDSEMNSGVIFHWDDIWYGTGQGRMNLKGVRVGVVEPKVRSGALIRHSSSNVLFLSLLGGRDLERTDGGNCLGWGSHVLRPHFRHFDTSHSRGLCHSLLLLGSGTPWHFEGTRRASTCLPCSLLFRVVGCNIHHVI
jgi:hypothetical protein